MAIYELPVTSREMKLLLRLPTFAATFFVVVLSAASGHAAETPKQNGFVPLLMPENCSGGEWRVLLWRDALPSSRCITSSELLKALLPSCKAGQVVAYDGSNFNCTDPAKLLTSKAVP